MGTLWWHQKLVHNIIINQKEIFFNKTHEEHAHNINTWRWKQNKRNPNSIHETVEVSTIAVDCFPCVILGVKTLYNAPKLQCWQNQMTLNIDNKSKIQRSDNIINRKGSIICKKEVQNILVSLWIKNKERKKDHTCFIFNFSF